MTVKLPTERVVIIGSGPAGWTAALYTSRATLNPLVFEGSAPNLPGGQLMITSEVENYPGFPQGIMGPELMKLFKEQALRFGCRIKTENVVKVDFSQRPYMIMSESGEKVFAETVLISTGANAKLLGIPREKELMSSGGGVSACATCDGAFFRGLDVAIVGGGDTAMEEAMFLTRYVNSVTVIHRSESFRASKIMLERARNNPKIKWKLNAVVDSLVTKPRPPFDKDGLVGVTIKNVNSNEMEALNVEGLFVAIGHQPNSELFAGVLERDSKGYIKTVGQSSKTNIAGVFACGDVQDSVYRQAVTAAGSGCMAAIDAERYLESLGQ